MQPNQPYQPPNNPNPNQPPQQSPAGNGAWDFLYTQQPQPPQKKSFFSEYKKLIIVAVSAVIILVGLTVIASLSSSSDKSQNQQLKAATTTVPMTNYNGQYFTLSYPSSLIINIDETLGEPEGWFLQFADSPENSTYTITVEASTEPSAYADGEQAVNEILYDDHITPTNVVTSDVVMAGTQAKKTVGEYTSSTGEQRYVIYATVQSGTRYITAKGTYPKSSQNITDSFDAMLGSIQLK
jgi:hypothetical protein